MSFPHVLAIRQPHIFQNINSGLIGAIKIVDPSFSKGFRISSIVVACFKKRLFIIYCTVNRSIGATSCDLKGMSVLFEKVIPNLDLMLLRYSIVLEPVCEQSLS
jgi:hypothetical protein